MDCQRGISVEGSRHIIRNNTIRESWSSGIYGTLTNATITENIIRHGYGNGIEIFSNNSIITRNWVTEKGGVGIELLENSNGNTIYNNSIGSNTESNAQDDGFNNQWDDGVSIGNLWGDFHTTPPYNIPGTAGSVDRYPLADTIPPILEGWGSLNITRSGNHLIQWYAFDFGPAVFFVFVDGVLNYTNDWYNDIISYRFDTGDLGVGLHNVTIVVYDTSGNWASDTVWVLYGYVISLPTTPTTPGEYPGIDFRTVFIGVSIVGVVIGLFAVWWWRKR
jgi:hypothetical protein